jgi:predicted Fe-Mo cluster-binding NifX family protein
MAKIRIAVPSALPGGLDVPVNPHFGHCDIYTVVDLDDGNVSGVGTLPNVPHEDGGCMGPVNHLAGHGIHVLIAGGMGMRPLVGLNQAGIDVYYGADAPSVRAAVQAFIAGSLPEFAPVNTCSG